MKEVLRIVGGGDSHLTADRVKVRGGEKYQNELPDGILTRKLYHFEMKFFIYVSYLSCVSKLPPVILFNRLLALILKMISQ